MGNIFISYAHEDRDDAIEIYEILKQHDLSPWIDEKNLLPGQDWKLEIQKTIRKSDVFIACLSTRSVSKRGYVQAELKKALEILDTIPEGDIYVIPVRLDECEVPERLSHLQWLDYFESDGMDRLKKSILQIFKHLGLAPQSSITTPGFIDKDNLSTLQNKAMEALPKHKKNDKQLLPKIEKELRMKKYHWIQAGFTIPTEDFNFTVVYFEAQMEILSNLESALRSLSEIMDKKKINPGHPRFQKEVSEILTQLNERGEQLQGILAFESEHELSITAQMAVRQLIVDTQKAEQVLHRASASSVISSNNVDALVSDLQVDFQTIFLSIEELQKHIRKIYTLANIDV